MSHLSISCINFSNLIKQKSLFYSVIMFQYLSFRFGEWKGPQVQRKGLNMRSFLMDSEYLKIQDKNNAAMFYEQVRVEKIHFHPYNKCDENTAVKDIYIFTGIQNSYINS